MSSRLKRAVVPHLCSDPGCSECVPTDSRTDACSYCSSLNHAECVLAVHARLGQLSASTDRTEVGYVLRSISVRSKELNESSFGIWTGCLNHSRHGGRLHDGVTSSKLTAMKNDVLLIHLEGRNFRLNEDVALRTVCNADSIRCPFVHRLTNAPLRQASSRGQHYLHNVKSLKSVFCTSKKREIESPASASVPLF